MIIIDYREKELLNSISDIEYKEKCIDIGDIHIIKNNKVCCVIERKTVEDLAASIKDGRSREQKKRLQKLDTKIFYLIEGSLKNKKINGIPNTTLMGFIINTTIRDNISVYHSQNLDESIMWLKKLYDKIDYIKEENLITEEAEYVDTIKLSKKSQLTTKTIFICQLTVIPGVSTKIADKIAEFYENMNCLIEAFKMNNNPDMMLANYEIIIKNNKKRKIGKVISKRIYDNILIVKN